MHPLHLLVTQPTEMLGSTVADMDVRSTFTCTKAIHQACDNIRWLQADVSDADTSSDGGTRDALIATCEDYPHCNAGTRQDWS